MASTGAGCEVVVNRVGQHSVWPAGRRPPLGWSTVGVAGTEVECLEYISRTRCNDEPADGKTADVAAEPQMGVFFYGLNMDVEVLREKGVQCDFLLPAFVENHAVVVRDKAILLRKPGSRSYGMIAALSRSKIDVLYSALTDYSPVSVLAFPFDPTLLEPRCGEPVHAMTMVHDSPMLDEKVNPEYLSRWEAILAKLRLSPAG